MPSCVHADADPHRGRARRAGHQLTHYLDGSVPRTGRKNGRSRLKKKRLREGEVVRLTDRLTDLADVGVGEDVHEEVDGAEAEALVVAGQRGLQLLVVDHAATVAVGGLEAGHHVGVGARRERRGHHRRERAAWRRRAAEGRGGGGWRGAVRRRGAVAGRRRRTVGVAEAGRRRVAGHGLGPWGLGAWGRKGDGEIAVVVVQWTGGEFVCSERNGMECDGI